MTDLEEQVAARQLDVEAACEAMEAARQRFLGAASEWLTAELPMAFREAAQRHHDRTEQLGAEGVRELQMDLAAEMDRLNEHVEQCLGTAKLWHHMRAPAGSMPMTYWLGDHKVERRELPEDFRGGVKCIEGAFSEPFAKRGYRADRYQRLVSLPYSVSDEMISVIQDCDPLAKALANARSELAKAEKAVSRARAADLWDES